ncbi:hypothetical protein PspLS_07962 [Pyricularia sp. CBS 133598]|nr:hypothetical protein PspLS_07962 [Pyricularia sp. CBS 133598]
MLTAAPPVAMRAEHWCTACRSRSSFSMVSTAVSARLTQRSISLAAPGSSMVPAAVPNMRTGFQVADSSSASVVISNTRARATGSSGPLIPPGFLSLARGAHVLEVVQDRHGLADLDGW